MTVPEIIAALKRTDGNFPRKALKAATEQPEAVTPDLLQLLREDTANLDAVLDEENYLGHIYAMFLLAQFREPQAYPLLIDLLRQDFELVDLALGDVLTEDTGRMLAAVGAGDTGPIEQLIEDPQLDEYLRAAGLAALIVLVTEGAKSRDDVMAYFALLFHGRLERQESFVWSDLVAVTSDLHPGPLMPEIEQAFADGLADPGYLSLEEVRALAVGEAGLRDKLQADKGHHFIRDAIAELKGWACFHEHETVTRKRPAAAPAPPPQPALQQRFANARRNAPCPCGSGKKYKRCCAP